VRSEGEIPNKIQDIGPKQGVGMRMSMPRHRTCTQQQDFRLDRKPEIIGAGWNMIWG
jgi:hypothetical protein